MTVLCRSICPMANKENSVMAVTLEASIDTFPDGFRELNHLTSTPEAISLFLEYLNKMVEIMMYEKAGDRGSHVARRLMLTSVPDNAEVQCGLNHRVADAMRWRYGGAGSLTIRHNECPYIAEDAIIYGGVSSIVKQEL